MKAEKLVIIGSGPSGYTAAIYAARAELKPVVFTGVESGGQLMYTNEVENFPGFPEGVVGPKFMMGLRSQSERFGAEIKDVHVTAVDFSERPFKLWTHLPDGENIETYKNGSPKEVAATIEKVKKDEPDMLAESIIISTGATAIRLGVPGEKKFFGQGVSSCAVCDAAFYKDKNVFVIGGGDSAMEDTMALTKFVSKVTIIHRRDSFRASKIMVDRVLKNKKVTVLWNSELKEIQGEHGVKKVIITTDGKDKEYASDGVFLAIGHRPVTNIFQGQLELLKSGYVLTRRTLTEQGLEKATKALDDKKNIQFPTMTSVKGVFAAGDVVDIRYKQAVTAAGMGCEAALDAERWLENQE
ncbi:MAG: FAD-dependent oxidoreductase [Candidatus Pacebacteria bacterium]|jgi:thioredoxin reductase (NADPH)|nr:FAD-dependent oxidoreductase [Candidatus Paceibacterota bacterium]MBT4652246.1 FAD-dependent oxidoreductase [Candidatus Paceibacterota bacterium]MBT6756658.1 FAD-dependent oxidoreductase [Candidatus Paceibacterota bacterium]MBT6921426.1 FAD-dependent oxidoreductase [Candidatus Paceibacterota bacterium]